MQCDLKAGGCGNCKHAGTACSGYRKHIDLMFCDQTIDTAKKVANRGSSNGVRRASSASSASKGSHSVEKKPVIPLTGQVLSCISVEEFALLYCRSHHLVRLPDANQCLKVVDEKLLYCLKALGAASYSTAIQSLQLAAQGKILSGIQPIPMVSANMSILRWLALRHIPAQEARAAARH